MVKININLAQQTIIDHYENPKNKIKKKSKFSQQDYQKGHVASTLCIDNIYSYVKIKNEKIVDLKFTGEGCAICTSSTDLMTILLKNKTIKQAKAIIINYFKMIEGKKFNKAILQNLIFYQNVNQQPNRIKCAIIGIESILDAIKNYEKKKK